MVPMIVFTFRKERKGLGSRGGTAASLCNGRGVCLTFTPCCQPLHLSGAVLAAPQGPAAFVCGTKASGERNCRVRQSFPFVTA